MDDTELTRAPDLDPAFLPTRNQDVDIFVPAAPGDRRSFDSTVEAVTAGEVSLMHPMHHLRPVPLSPGQEVHLSYHTERGSYRAVSQVATVPDNLDSEDFIRNPKPLVVRLSEISRVQRRGHLRLPVPVPVAFAEFEGPAVKSGGGQAGEQTPSRIQVAPQPDRLEHEATTLDLSGGGFAMVTQASLQPGSPLLIKLDIEGTGVWARGTVVWASHHPDDERQRVGVAFTQIAEAEQERIIRFIFAEQRRMLRRGLL